MLCCAINLARPLLLIHVYYYFRTARWGSQRLHVPARIYVHKSDTISNGPSVRVQTLPGAPHGRHLGAPVTSCWALSFRKDCATTLLPACLVALFVAFESLFCCPRCPWERTASERQAKTAAIALFCHPPCHHHSTSDFL